MDPEFIKIDDNSITIDLEVGFLQKHQGQIDKFWHDHYDFVDDSYRTILNNITSPMCGKVSMSYEAPRTKRKTRYNAARTMQTQEVDVKPNDVKPNDVKPNDVKPNDVKPVESEQNSVPDTHVSHGVSSVVDGQLIVPHNGVKALHSGIKAPHEVTNHLPSEIEQNLCQTVSQSLYITPKKSNDTPESETDDRVNEMEVNENKEDIVLENIENIDDNEEWNSAEEDDDDNDDEETFKTATKSVRSKRRVNDSTEVKGTKRKLQNNTSISNKPTVPSTVKPKKKKLSVYYTPSGKILSVRPVTRSKTRVGHDVNESVQSVTKMSGIVSGTVTKGSTKKIIMSTPSTSTRMVTRQMVATSSGGSTSSNSSINKLGSTTRKGTVSRIKNNTVDTKFMTESAAKRRKEEEDRKRLRLLVAEEKEKKALEQKNKILQQKVMEQRQRSAEKQKKIERLREQQRLENEERFKKDMKKREEDDLRRKMLEEEKKEMVKKRQEALLKKHQEYELRKQEQEEKERQVRLLKQEELKKKQEQAKENLEREESLAALINNHNKNISQQKTTLQSGPASISSSNSSSNLAKKHELPVVAASAPVTKSVQDDNSISIINIQQSYLNTIQTQDQQTNPAMNQTFVKPKDVNYSKMSEISMNDSNNMSKKEDQNNYDITQVKSDSDDDERNPTKPIPDWAKGPSLAMAINIQFNKTYKHCLKESFKIFPHVQLPVELGLIFHGKKPVIAKYSKRTSSAYWDTPPASYLDISDMSVSPIKEK